MPIRLVPTGIGERVREALIRGLAREILGGLAHVVAAPRILRGDDQRIAEVVRAGDRHLGTYAVGLVLLAAGGKLLLGDDGDSARIGELIYEPLVRWALPLRENGEGLLHLLAADEPRLETIKVDFVEI